MAYHDVSVTVQCLAMQFLVSWLMTVYLLTEPTNGCSTKIHRHKDKVFIPTITHLSSEPRQQNAFLGGDYDGKEKAEFIHVFGCARPHIVQNEVMTDGEEEVGCKPRHSRMHSSGISLFIAATCLRLFGEEDVSSQGRVPLFFWSCAGRVLLLRGSSVRLLSCVQQFLFIIAAQTRCRRPAADSGPVSTSFFFFFPKCEHFLRGLA